MASRPRLPPRARSLAGLLAQGRLERITPDLDGGRAMVAQAEVHLQSAGSIKGSDSAGAYGLLYDAARKAVSGHMLAKGYRAKNRAGAHEAVVIYAELELGGRERAQHVKRFDQMRRVRNRAEYGLSSVGLAQVENDLEHATRIVQAAKADL